MLWRSGARYDPARGSVRSWILGVVHNRAVDALRRHVVRDSRDVGDATLAERVPAAELTDVEAARREESRRVRGARLPVDRRISISSAPVGMLPGLAIRRGRGWGA